MGYNKLLHFMLVCACGRLIHDGGMNQMPTTQFDKESIKQSIIGKIQRYNGRTLADATPQQIYYAVASTIRDQIMEKCRWNS